MSTPHSPLYGGLSISSQRCESLKEGYLETFQHKQGGHTVKDITTAKKYYDAIITTLLKKERNLMSLKTLGSAKFYQK